MSIRSMRITVAGGAGLVMVGVLCMACSGAKPNPPSPSPPALWGDPKPVVSVKELMRDMIDPGLGFCVRRRESRVDEDRDGGAACQRRMRTGTRSGSAPSTLAEGISLLKIPRPFAPPGDENNSRGPEASELSPAQIKAKLEADPVLWNAKIEALRNVGLEVLEIVKKRKTDELFEAGGNLDQACEGCHIEYWYPGDTALLQKVDRGLRDLSRPKTPADGTSRGR